MPFPIFAFFATESWLAAHGDTAVAFANVIRQTAVWQTATAKNGVDAGQIREPRTAARRDDGPQHLRHGGRSGHDRANHRHSSEVRMMTTPIDPVDLIGRGRAHERRRNVCHDGDQIRHAREIRDHAAVGQCRSAEPQITAMLPAGVSLHTTRLRLVGGGNQIAMLRAPRRCNPSCSPTAQVDRIMFHCTASRCGRPEIVGEIRSRIATVTDIPVVVTSDAVVSALDAFGARKIVLLTPYLQDINDREVPFPCAITALRSCANAAWEFPAASACPTLRPNAGTTKRWPCASPRPTRIS